MNRLAVFLFIAFIIPVGLLVSPLATDVQAAAYAQSLSPEHAFDAELIVYYTNLQRRAHGLAPLKISRDLTEAALTFAEDVVVNMDAGYCGHTDSDGRNVGQRIENTGLIGAQMWGENVVCGVLSPQEAVDAWMASAGHKENILQPEFTEIGVGHFVQGDSGYIVQNFALDINTAPVIINNESPSSTSRDVTLYIYPHNVRSGMAGMGTAVEMMISNSPRFDGASWQPYTTELSWTLSEGEGAKRVYVATRDSNGRRSVRFDDIYLGSAPRQSIPLDSYPAVETAISRDVIVNQLPEAEFAGAVQLSLDWELSESDETSRIYYGDVTYVDDHNAHGRRALRMGVSPELGYSVHWATDYIAGQELVAYARLKVEDNLSSGDVVNIELRGNGNTYASMNIKASDFGSTGVYQEFPLAFSIPEDFKPALLEIHVQQKKQAVVYFDGVAFFTGAQSMNADLPWSLAHLAHRDRGLRIRTVSAEGAVSAAHLVYPTITTNRGEDAARVVVEQPEDTQIETPQTDDAKQENDDASFDGQGAVQIQASETHVSLEAEQGRQTTVKHRVAITCSNCPRSDWSVGSSATWLSGSRVGDDVEINVNAAGLSVGRHTANLTVVPEDHSVATSTEIQVIVTVNTASVALAESLYLPLTFK